MSLHVDGFLGVRNLAAALLQKRPERIRRFARQEEGSILIFSLFLLIMMLMISGMAVDLMRVETERARLQSTLDRAVLAGASLEQTLDSKEVVLDYFKKAGLSSYISADDVIVTPGDNSKTVYAKAFMSVDSLFMKLLGIDQIDAPAAGEAEESLSNIEISLVLDISGSMGWNSSYSGDKKIDDLIDAAQEFVYLMQCNPDDIDGVATCTVEADTVSISVVPYSEQVVVGESLLQHMDAVGINVTNEHTYSSCIDFDASDFNSTAILTGTTIKRSGDIDPWTNYRGSSSMGSRDSSRTCKPYADRVIVPFENSYSDLQTYIGNLSEGGNTSIDLGMKWGAALLDPAFAPVVQHMNGTGEVTLAFDDRPYAFNARSMQKVIVLMTDGENTSQHMLKSAYRSGNMPVYKNSADGKLSAFNATRSGSNKYWWPDQNAWFDHAYGDGSYDICTTRRGSTTCTTTVEPGDPIQMTYEEFWHEYNVDFYQEEFSFFPNPIDVWGYGTKNTRLDAICDAAKAQDIEIFTIGFETSEASSAIMQGCASSDAHHFDVNGLNISNAFTSIAREIHELRLTN